MKGLGIAKGFDKSRANGWFLSVAQDGRRPKQYFPDARARDKAFNAKMLEVRSIGVDASKTISVEDRHALVEMHRLAAPTGFSVLEIFRRGLDYSPSAALSKVTVEQAMSAFLVEQATRRVDEKISAVREKELKVILKRYSRTAGRMLLSQCTRATLKTYLASLGVGPQSRLNYARTLSFFFKWCVIEGMILRDPTPAQESVYRIPTVFNNEQVAALFACAWGLDSSLIPMLAVQWYAGLRPGASHHLRWEDVDFERRKFLIQPHTNKLRQPDIVQDLPLAVFALLSRFRRDTGPIAPAGHVKRTQTLHHELGYRNAKGSPRWPEDVARHTFASNLYSLYEQDTKRVETVLLHSSSEMLRKHYLLKNIPREAAETYFAAHLPSA